MEVGDLITNLSVFDLERSKIGIITGKEPDSYSIKWIYVPVYDEYSEFENKLRFSCTQTYIYSSERKIAIFPVVFKNNVIKVINQLNEL